MIYTHVLNQGGRGCGVRSISSGPVPDAGEPDMLRCPRAYRAIEFVCHDSSGRWHNRWDLTPTVLRTGPYRFFFFSNDKHEPPHVHVEREAKRAKFWLELVEVETNDGFAARELVRVRRIVEEHREELLRTWHDFFSD